MYECEKCNKSFKYNRDYQRHINRKYPCTGLKLTCAFCNKKYKSSEGLSKHRKKCRMQRDDLEVADGQPMVNRRRRTSPSNKTSASSHYVCEYCGITFSHKQSYYRHKKHRCKANEENENIFDTRVLEEIKKRLDNIEKFTYEEGYAPLNSYGNEDMGYLKEDFFSILEKATTIEDLSDFMKFGFEQIHCNPNRIENHNVAISTKKDFFDKGLMNIYKNEGWEYAENHKVIYDSTKKFVNLIEEQVDEQISNNKQIPDNVTKSLHHVMNFVRLFDDNEYTREEKKVINSVKTGIFILIDNFKKSASCLENKEEEDEIPREPDTVAANVNIETRTEILGDQDLND